MVAHMEQYKNKLLHTHTVTLLLPDLLHAIMMDRVFIGETYPLEIFFSC